MNEFCPILLSKFTLYSVDHYLPFIISFILVVLLSYFSYKLPIKKKVRIGIIISIIPIISVLLNTVHLYYNIFNEDTQQFLLQGLPLHACHFIGLFNLIGLVRKERRFLSLAYFWCMSFNIMALMMPELIYGFPDYLYLFFFLTHCGNFIAIFYSVLALNLKPSFKDLTFTILVTNIILLTTLALNLQFDTNYSYLLRKPITTSILDLFGKWPTYLITTEFVGVLLFYMFYKAFEICVDPNKLTKLE